jgi:hypothetical protein
MCDTAARQQPPASCPGQEPRREPTLRSPAQDAPAADWKQSVPDSSHAPSPPTADASASLDERDKLGRLRDFDSLADVDDKTPVMDGPFIETKELSLSL